MPLLKTLCVILCLPAFAAAQATVIRGTASNWAPGVYVGPFVPLITTPSVTLSTVSPSPVGASNATFGNVAGATNATLSGEFIAPPPVGVSTEPIFYGTDVTPPLETVQSAPRPFNLGVVSRGPGVAKQLAQAGPGKKATRTYNNQDIEHVN